MGIAIGLCSGCTVASPLYRKRWKFRGLRTEGGVTFPDLRSPHRWLCDEMPD